jgi:predicted DNA-binding transcriptional regulator YafY
LNEIDQHSLIQEPGGRYRLDPATYLSNVRLTRAEALSIYLAMRRFIRHTSKAPDFFVSAIRKVALALRHPLLTAQLAESSLVLEHERAAISEHGEVWQTLLRAWQENILVRLWYQRGRSDEITEHEFEPFLFEPAVLSHGVYVIGWSRTRNDLRTFKLDRIHRASLTTGRFEKPDKLKPDDLLRNAWGVWYGQNLTRVVLQFAPDVASRVQETVWHPSQKMTPLDDGGLLWEVEIAGTTELLSWIRGWAHEVKVLEPEDLRNDVIRDFQTALALYEGEG